MYEKNSKLSITFAANADSFRTHASQLDRDFLDEGLLSLLFPCSSDFLLSIQPQYLPLRFWLPNLEPKHQAESWEYRPYSWSSRGYTVNWIRDHLYCLHENKLSTFCSWYETLCEIIFKDDALVYFVDKFAKHSEIVAWISLSVFSQLQIEYDEKNNRKTWKYIFFPRK